MRQPQPSRFRQPTFATKKTIPVLRCPSTATNVFPLPANYRHRSLQGPLTRRYRQLVGCIPLHDPFVYDDCLLCTKGYYREEDLRSHYARHHELDFGTAPLPRVMLEILDFQLYRQESLRCGVCLEWFADDNDLRLHKASSHVNPKYMRHVCHGCNERFLLTTQLESHQFECPSSPSSSTSSTSSSPPSSTSSSPSSTSRSL